MRSVSTLTALRRFIEASTEAPAEVRSYIEEHIIDLARELGVPAETITSMLEDVKDDSLLATKILAILKKAQASRRDIKREGRARSAQAAADALASRAVLDGERVQLDIQALLSSVLTRRSDMIVFATEVFTVGVYQAPLFDLARVKLRGFTAFVDAEGLHIRWRDGRGGMNLRPRVDPSADHIVMTLSRNTGAVAA